MSSAARDPIPRGANPAWAHHPAVAPRVGGRAEPLMERRTFIAMIAGGLLAAPLAAEAQELVYYEGRVQWLAGSTLILATDEGWSIRVDLTRVDQREYLGLSPRVRIIVSGVVSEDGNYLIGLSIRRTRSEFQSP